MPLSEEQIATLKSYGHEKTAREWAQEFGCTRYSLYDAKKTHGYELKKFKPKGRRRPQMGFLPPTWASRPFVQWHLDYQRRAREQNPDVVLPRKVSDMIKSDRSSDIDESFGDLDHVVPYKALWTASFIAKMRPVFGMEWDRIGGDEYESCLRWWYDQNQCGADCEILNIDYEWLRKCCDGMGVERMSQISMRVQELVP